MWMQICPLPLHTVANQDVVYAASLKHRDIAVLVNEPPPAIKDLSPRGMIPGSDGAGEVIITGAGVTKFKKQDAVLPLVYTSWIRGPLGPGSANDQLGGPLDGVFRQYGVFHEDGLVRMPSNLSFLEACTLPSTALAAWNALHGLQGREVRQGDWVLTEGTGSVGHFAIQFARAAGAKVIATTSSPEKVAFLRALGVDLVIDSSEDTDWGRTAKEHAWNIGVQHVINVGGEETLKHAIDAIGPDGLISIIGDLGADQRENPDRFIYDFGLICIIRRLVTGNRDQMEDMVRAVQLHDIRPMLDEKIFKLEELKEAYRVSFAPCMIEIGVLTTSNSTWEPVRTAQKYASRLTNQNGLWVALAKSASYKT